MNLDQLKSSWQNAGQETLSEKDLALMTRLNNHPTLRNIRRKLLFEIFSLSLFSFVYYDALDGDKKPLYVNILLVISILIYVSGNLAGYLLVKNPVLGNSLQQSIRVFLARIKGIFIFSIFSSVIYSVTLLLFFSSTIAFTKSKYAMLATLAFAFVVMFYVSFKRWKNKLDHYKRLTEDFE